MGETMTPRFRGKPTFDFSLPCPLCGYKIQPPDPAASTSRASGPASGGSIGLASGKSSWWVAMFPANLGVDSLVVGFYRDNGLICEAHVRTGMVSATRRELFERLGLKDDKDPAKIVKET